MNNEFRPALLIVDLQEDFCPPHGALAVAEGRLIAPIINDLLQLPFVKKIATKDFHPPHHISFASNHPEPHNRPFTSFATIPNPHNPDETQISRLWPVHCVQGTPGAELIPELDTSRIDLIVEKGQDSRVEMYSAFEAPFRDPVVKEASSGLAQKLREAGVTDVFVVGLAMDYCVRSTAIDAAAEGFKTYVISEATKAVDSGEQGWGKTEKDLESADVTLVRLAGEELGKVRLLQTV
ncbi:Isochorismatase-like protein [Lentinula aciculospora]|uniref:nicotinamidase n=1 Tax=Lentinula aciculospora TaxID=153920 RepID=A0A9W9A0K2_9AGAR|nr:Isochorismatase-like protein [Lentinula aciculospora]